MITGCSIGEDMSNTPTKRVEEYLNNYQTLDSNVLANWMLQQKMKKCLMKIKKLLIEIY